MNEVSNFVYNIMRKARQDNEYSAPGAEELRDKNRKELLACFGKEVIYAKEIPNEYSSDSVNHPWFVVTTCVGHIKIGWRSHVISIDFADTDLPKEVTAELLFPEEKSRYIERIIKAFATQRTFE